MEILHVAEVNAQKTEWEHVKCCAAPRKIGQILLLVTNAVSDNCVCPADEVAVNTITICVHNHTLYDAKDKSVTLQNTKTRNMYSLTAEEPMEGTL